MHSTGDFGTESRRAGCGILAAAAQLTVAIYARHFTKCHNDRQVPTTWTDEGGTRKHAARPQGRRMLCGRRCRTQTTASQSARISPGSKRRH